MTRLSLVVLLLVGTASQAVAQSRSAKPASAAKPVATRQVASAVKPAVTPKLRDGTATRHWRTKGTLFSTNTVRENGKVVSWGRIATNRAGDSSFKGRRGTELYTAMRRMPIP